MKQRFAAVAAFVALVVALATPASAAPPEALNPLVGSTYRQSVAPGVILTFHQINAVEAIATVPATIPQTTQDLFSCPNLTIYWCAWTGLGATGTFAKYNMENVYANVANGVAHCWNLTAPMADNTDTWFNYTAAPNARTAVVVQWQNCNLGGGFFNMLAPTSHWDCRAPGYESWCYAATAQSSLYAGATN
jgi:hypothetical protein